MPDRTIIDILRKGNQELFHSSIIAWLLDPLAEHGLGTGFLDGFAEVVEQRGNPKMRSALRVASALGVSTETTARKSRYDIVLRIGPTTVVIENKTKNLGDEPQFDKYQGDSFVLVGLGLCDISFSAQVRGKYPALTYADVLSILDRLPRPPASDFAVLLDHYRRFLRRELGLLAEIDLWSETGDVSHAARSAKIVEGAGTYTNNDKRFLNLYLLERLRADLLRNRRWSHCRYKTDKNMQSGVWLALFEIDREPGVYRFHEPLAAACKQYGVALWFHVELQHGLLVKTDQDKAGVVQLRCSSTADNAKVVEAFRKSRPLQDGERYAAKLSRSGSSYFLLARPLLRKHLSVPQFNQYMDAFAKSLGLFAQS
jgi:hypothetical protein